MLFQVGFTRVYHGLGDWFQPGIHLMGLCCEPVQLLSDIERMGISVTRQLETIH